MQLSNLPSMFFGAKREIFKNAKLLRENMTEAEKMLWERLNKSQLGVRFRRQHPIDIFIVDFYCHKHHLVIEVDGEIHKQQLDYDEGRTAELEKLGLKVVRFTNEEVLSDVEMVMMRIKVLLNS